MVGLLNYLLGHNTSGNNSLSTAQLELLLCLSRQRVDLSMGQAWISVAGPLEPNIARFIGEGLLEEAPVADRLDAKYKAAEIRQLLEGRGITARGRKQEMIATLAGSMTAAEAESLVAEVRLFRLTEPGKARIEAYRAIREGDRAVVEADAIASLVKGELRKAWSRLSQYYSGQLGADPRWSRPLPEAVECEVSRLLKMPYNDLPLSEPRRKELGAWLALSVLLGESMEAAGKRLATFAGESFDWAGALAFHRPNPCGSPGEEADALALAELYASTRILEALSACELHSLQTARLGKGIRLLPLKGSDCSVCHSGKFLYAWSELGELPKLPRQIGCCCTYAAWL